MEITIEKGIADPPCYIEDPALEAFELSDTRFLSHLFRFQISAPMTRGGVTKFLLSAFEKDLESIFYFEKPNEVKQFLTTHAGLNLSEILFNMHKHIRQLFGEEADLCGEVYRDPEEDFEGLFVTVRSHVSPERALDLLREFDEEWWLDVDSDVRNLVEVDVEPIP